MPAPGPVRTRFAPSPTGYLHIGGARTALYNWLFARRHGGVFVLRVEDTDKERSTDENTRAILEGMKWLGLDWDEGPILQSSRTAIYTEHVEKLLAEGKAYRCYCTREDLDAKRELAQKEKRPFRYDRTCRYPARSGVTGVRSGPFTVRVAFEEEGQTVVDDLVKGPTVFENKELSDEIILRSDGSPVYNLCVVIDDAQMNITHVLRGDDHLNNTPKQIQLYKAFGFELPKFGHMPLIHGPDGKKLSKRNSVVAVDAYRDMGYLPEAMVNFLVRIGWAHGDEEIFTIERLKEIFDVEGIGKSAGIYDIKKLENLNLHYIKGKSADEGLALLTDWIGKRGWKVPDRPVLETMWACTRERSRTLAEMVDQLAFYFADDAAYEFDAKAFDKNVKGKADLLASLAETIAATEPLDGAAVEASLKTLAEQKQLKGMGAVAQPLRVALTGTTVSPPITDVVVLLGKDRVARRLERARSLAG